MDVITVTRFSILCCFRLFRASSVVLEWRKRGELNEHFHSCSLASWSTEMWSGRAIGSRPLRQLWSYLLYFFLCNGHGKLWRKIVFSSMYFAPAIKNRSVFLKLERFQEKSPVFLSVFILWGTCSPAGQVFLRMCPNAVTHQRLSLVLFIVSLTSYLTAVASSR